MASQKPPNPNTTYGRRKIAEQKFYAEQQWRAEHPEEAKSDDTFKIVFVIIIVVVAVVIGIVVNKNKNDYYGERGGHYKINKNGNKEYYRNK